MTTEYISREEAASSATASMNGYGQLYKFRSLTIPTIRMGGFMSHEQVLYESDLVSFPNEVYRNISLLKIIYPFHRSELKEYGTRK